MFASLKRILLWGCRSFIRQGGASSATLIVMAIMISLVTSLFLLRKITDFSVATLEEKVALIVYFKEDSAEDDILTVKRELSQLPAIDRVEYISRDKALEDFTKRHQENSIIIDSLAMLGENPLLAHINIKTKAPSQYESVSGFLEKASFTDLIDHINYSEVSPVINKVEQITNGLTNFGIVLSIVFAVFSVLIIFNTIKLATYSLKDEIGVMRLVGASNWFIRGPLLIQICIAGFLAAVLSMLIFLPLVYFLGPKIEYALPGLDIFSYFMANIWKIIAFQLATGIGLGIISSTIAIKRYLKI